MAKTTNIEWCDSTWNPWYGCTKVSEGCANCYMDRWAARTGRNPAIVARAKPATFLAPLKWKDPRVIFVCSLSDFFHPDVPERWRQQAMEVIYYCERHTFLILTKRPELVNSLVPKDFWLVNRNAWLGVSAENQKRADERIPVLLDIPASVRFVSCEPLLEKVNLWPYLADMWWTVCEEYDWTPLDDLHWVITGGESGPHARPCDLDWVREIRDQCMSVDVPFFHKQHGGSKKIEGSWGGRELDGKIWNEFPSDWRTYGKEEKSTEENRYTV